MRHHRCLADAPTGQMGLVVAPLPKVAVPLPATLVGQRPRSPLQARTGVDPDCCLLLVADDLVARGERGAADGTDSCDLHGSQVGGFPENHLIMGAFPL
jgi:hypothetical protein